MKPMFVELSKLRDARNLWDVACVTLGKNSHRLYVRTSGSSYRVDFFKFEESPYCMRCIYCEVVEIPDQYDENGEFVEGGSTQCRCNWTSTRVEFDDGSYEYLEMPCC